MFMTVVVTVPHKSEEHGHLHETHGHKTPTSFEHGQEIKAERKGISLMVAVLL